MGTFTTEAPTSVAENKPKRGGADALEKEAIGLDVSVRIHGSQVTAVVLDTTEHVEPFEEDTSTMIVFPRGAVVKLRARVRTGHAVVLTHVGTKQTALCRIIQVNSAANVSHYVKLEFIQPAPGFWGVHFPSDDSVPVTAAHEEPASVSEERKQPPAPVAPVMSAPPAIVSPAPPVLPRVEAPQPVAKPFVREVVKDIPKPAAPPVNYGISEDPHTNEVVPLANTPPARAPSAPKPPAIIAPPPRAATPSIETPPIFDSLSTGEEIFGKEPAAAEQTAILKPDPKPVLAFGRSLDPSSLLQGEEVPKRHTGLKAFLSVATVVILAAGAVYYVRQYRRNARQTLSATAPASIPQAPSTAPSAAPSATPVQTAAESPATPALGTPSPAKNQPASKREPVRAEGNSITITPAHDAAKSTVPESHPTISNGLANIYAGDLAARPQAAQHNSAPVDAPLPTISSSPKDLASASANAGLNSLVGGAPSNLPAPPKPAAVVRGGQVTQPRLIHSVPPVYPAVATANRTEGDVEIEAVIDPTGKVTSAKVISGPALLRAAAVDAVRQQRYSPGTLDGKPITMQYKVTIRFRLGQ